MPENNLIIIGGVVVAIIIVLLISQQAFKYLKSKKEKELISLAKEEKVEIKEEVKEETVKEEENVETAVVEETQSVEEETVVEEVKETETVTEVKEETNESDEEVNEVELVKNATITEEPSFLGLDVMYNRSFKAKVIQSSDDVKRYYSELKNELLSYKGMKARLSWDKESFNIGRKYYARMSIKGKTLMLYLALDPNEYLDTKYLVEDSSEVAKYEDVPTLYRIKGERRLKYAKELIAIMMQEVVKNEIEPVDYCYPYEETDALIEQKLIKVKQVVTKGTVIKERVDVVEAKSMMNDEEAKEAIEIKETVVEENNDEVKEVKAPVKGKKAIINIDELSRNFKANDVVTLEALKAKKLVNNNVGFIKVLARGYIDKPLVVEANDYSLDAVKMITITGGKAIQIK